MDLIKTYEKLLNTYGEQNWWPVDREYHRRNKSDPREEIVIGAVLTQNTNWNNVEKALENLKRINALNFKAVTEMPVEYLQELIKPSGFYKLKAERLKTVCGKLSPVNIVENISREELLKIKGVGRETADSILLYAGNRSYFVIDTYTKRLTERMCGIKGGYEDLRKFFEENLPKDTKLFQEYHALIVKHAKVHCGKKPSCENCPLSNECQYFLSSGEYLLTSTGI